MMEILQEEKDRAQNYLDIADVILVAIDAEQKVSLINKKGCEILGYKEEEIIGKNWFENFLPKQVRGEVNAIYKKLMSGEIEPVEFAENLVLTRSGNEKIIAWHNTLLKDEAGKIIGTLSSGEDITERKKAEEMILSLSKFPLENPNPILRIDAKGEILYRNPSVGDLLEATGLSEKEIFKLLPENLKKLIAEGMKTGKPLSELEVNVKDRIYSYTVVPIVENKYVNLYGRDITERRKAEQALRESEKKHRTLLENLPQLIFLKDKNSVYISANKNYCKSLGIKPEEIKGKTDFDFYPKEFAQKYRKDDWKVMRTGKTMEVVEEYIEKKEKKIVQTVKTPVLGNDGKPIGVLGIFWDITERKKVDEALRESEKKYRALFEGVAEGLLVADIQTKEFKYANPAICRMLGYTEDGLKQMSVADIHPKEELEHVISEFEAQARGDKTLAENLPCLRKDGGIVYADISTTKVTIDGREFNVGFFKDITKRKRAEEALKESEEKYRLLIENQGEGIATADLDENFIFVNPAAEKIFGVIKGGLVGRNLKEFTSTEQFEFIQEQTKKRHKEEKGSYEIEIMNAKGEKRFLLLTAAPWFDKDGVLTSTFGIFRDITERKQLQQQLIQSEKLAAVGTLAYGIAHEFNNILAGMLANAELGLITQDSRQIKECFKIIADSSYRASSITRNLLAFSSNKEAKKELIDITEPLRSVLAITRRELEKLNIGLVEKFKPVPKICCDAGQFSEVFLNMLTNARDAMRAKGGKLTILLELIGENIQIIFEDTGCGIPEKIKGKLFEPFVTTKGALGKSEIPGTGLGLFLSYGIIEGYKGRIEVESEVSKGTRFTILIPVSKNLPCESIRDNKIEPSEKLKRKLKILLVDDEKVISFGLKKFLESRGHQVTASLKAEEGLEHFEKEKFDLVLSDIAMPDMDGIELIKKIKEKSTETKVIAITGHILKEKENKAREAGADEVLIKPFKNEVLYMAISKLVAGGV
jgi:PAS domain S-box-containing protein